MVNLRALMVDIVLNPDHLQVMGMRLHYANVYCVPHLVSLQ